MASRHLICTLLILLTFGFASSDIDKDRQECASTLVGLATCLPYAGGDAKAPTMDCCSGLKDVLKVSKKCLCILVKDRNDPSLGLKINATLALGLPTVCRAPANISECPSLLHLAPHSPDAKVFEDFVKSSANKGITTTAPSTTGSSSGSNATSARLTNDAGRGRRWLGVEMVCLMTTLMLLVLISSPIL